MNKKIKISLIILTGFLLLSKCIYGIDLESISKNVYPHRETLKLSQFKRLKTHPTYHLIHKQKKAIYESKETKRLWMVQENFDYLCFRQYIVGDLFRLLLGNRAPELRLIKNSKGKLMLGSEFIPNFKTLKDFFNLKASNKNLQILNDCFPTGCESEQFGGSLRISGAEEVMALMIVLSDIDGHENNIGLIPSQDDPNLFEVGKIDHEEALNSLIEGITLRSLAKVVFGEDQDYFTLFDYEKFDLNKIADAFDTIASISDNLWGGTILRRAQEISKENINEEIRGYIDLAEEIAEHLNDRKKRCKNFAIGLRCEAAVRADNFEAIKDLVGKNGFHINRPVDYLHIDTLNEKPAASLTQLWSLASDGDSESLNLVAKYALENGPITVLEMAVRYNKLELTKKLAPLSNTKSIQRAIKASIETNNNEILSFFANDLSRTKVKEEL